MPDWGELLGFQVPILESVLRGTLAFLSVYFLMRIVGRREAGGLSTNDLLVVVLVGQAMGVGLGGPDAGLADGVVVVATILLWSVVLDAAAYRFPKIRTLLKSSPSLLVEDGDLNRRAMRREFMEEDELLSHLRLHGIESLDEVARAFIEPNGRISVIRRDGRGEEPSGRPPGMGSR